MPKNRYFVYKSGKFGDQTAYIVSRERDGYIVMRNGEKRIPSEMWKLGYSLSVVGKGKWKEISCTEAQKLLRSQH